MGELSSSWGLADQRPRHRVANNQQLPVMITDQDGGENAIREASDKETEEGAEKR